MNTKPIKGISNKKPFIETITYSHYPELRDGGFLEKKNGEICLYLGDELMRKSQRTFTVTRIWLRGTFNRDHYTFAK